MDQDLQEKADERFERALEASGARDPREYYRERLRELKQSSPDGYERAVEYYRESLVPSIASGDADPLAAWRSYGLRLAELSAEGRTVAIDGTGRADSYAEDTPADRLVLHVPDSGTRALLVALPPDPTPAQKATYRLLVRGKQRLPHGPPKESS